MATSVQSKFNINGFVDTGKTVIDNIESLAASVGAWATYDIHQGKWAFIINEDTASVYTFDDSNILGNINVSGTGLLELYNSVEVQFPHRDLADVKDYRRVTIPTADRFQNERDNRLLINMDTVNDPVQAEMHALRELKQARMNTTIEFATDFNAMGLNAGDIITVNNEQYDFVNQKFRVIRIVEQDTDDGQIVLQITALEWDPEIVNYGSITRYQRDRATNILPLANNTDIQGSDNSALQAQNFTQLFPAQFGMSASNVQTYLGTWGTPGWGSTGYTGGNPFFVSFGFTDPLSNIIITAGAALGTWDYEYYDGSSVQSVTGTYAFIPCVVKLLYDPGTGNTQIGEYTVDWQTSAVTFPLNNAQPGTYTITYEPLPTYDLNQPSDNRIFHYNHLVYPDSAGNGVTVNVLGFDV